jgi:hypothetical protein
MPNLSQEEFKRLVRSKTIKIKVYQADNGYWRVCWFGGDAYYVSLGTGKGYTAWEKALDIAIRSKNKDPFTYAMLSSLKISMEKNVRSKA